MRKSYRPNNLLLLSVGAVAGVLAGVVLADRVGGIDRLLSAGRRRVRSKDSDRADGLVEPYGLHDADGSYEFDEYDGALSGAVHDPDTGEHELAPESFAHLHSSSVNNGGHHEVVEPSELIVLEARVLEAFHHDPILRERAIDIGAIAKGVIELTGWVHSDAELPHALTIARGVPDVLHVVDQLAVRKPSRARRATDSAANNS